ncbi:restriction endonuclease subunit M [Ktedonobacter sp. SOSP1-52]|uniref:DNA methyltransferase n=1 Tax=Ktedonobacter sp. SOSP1-52 TaxID=2778366 RepID=UPI0019169E6A|nr:DNA methyltransferase [Ktedonobacter sp. SOSP1-52]GHO67719.1 restriction endonuclease subunit M [Ktedonobacter sp. SOSP1-52]
MEDNTLFYGDNLDILRQYIKDDSVDLIYLDPPFNSSRNYNVLFKDESGQDSESQITAFEDTWHWNHIASQTYDNLVTEAAPHVSSMIEALHNSIGTNQMMAYLVMMTARLVELHRALKPTGSLYLHCDPTASHYLRMILDTIFGTQNFRNFIVWKRADAHNDVKKQFGALSDHIIFYAKSKEAIFNKQHIGFQEKTLHDWYQYLEFPDGSIRRMTKEERETQEIPKEARRFNTGDLRSPNPRPNLMYDYKGYKPHRNGWAVSYEKMCELDEKGLLIFPSSIEGRIMRKRYLDEQPGAVLGDVWTDISQIRGTDAELLGYPTQKPISLLERIISASSNPGDIVLDPFCGCGTAIAAAQKLDRKWIGIDITHLSIALQKYRLEAMYPGIKFKVVGEPTDIGAAKQLAKDDRYQFQWWALSLIRARPLGGQEGSKVGKKGSDKGIDGVIAFVDDSSNKAKRVLVQVKSGHVKSGDIRDLVGTITREKAVIGVFLTLEAPTRDMLTEALSAGYYYSPGWGEKYPRLQILSISELLQGAKVKMPPQFGTFKQAQKVQQASAEQQLLDLG